MLRYQNSIIRNIFEVGLLYILFSNKNYLRNKKTIAFQNILQHKSVHG